LYLLCRRERIDLGIALSSEEVATALTQCAPLIVAWPKDHPLLSDKRLKENLGQAGYASSLRDAVRFCLTVTAEPSDSTNTPNPKMEIAQTGGDTFTPAVSR
jgi:hypothetical protein